MKRGAGGTSSERRLVCYDLRIVMTIQRLDGLDDIDIDQLVAGRPMALFDMTIQPCEVNYLE